MARQKVVVAKRLANWQEADEALLKIARLERQIEGLEAAMQDDIEAVKREAVKMVKPLQEEKNLLALALELFCEARKEEFGERKSRELNYGRVGWRQSTRILIRRVKDCVESLKSLGLGKCLRVSENPNKEAMKQLEDGVLAQVGASRKVEDVFGYELNQERLREVL